MASEDKTKATETVEETKKTENPDIAADKGVEELTVEQQLQKITEQNQALMNEIARLKKTSDKNASEAAEYKRQYRATLSAQEQASQEKAEKEAEREEQFQKLLRENSVNKYVRQYMAQGYTEELAQKAAEAMYDGDTDSLFKVQSEATSAIVKAKESEWQKSRPDVFAGTGTNTVTKEQFDNMNMLERSKLRHDSPELYERLVGRK